ncbi:hypothetical protein V6N13_010971 [Hibiscus sabdariffa]
MISTYMVLLLALKFQVMSCRSNRQSASALTDFGLLLHKHNNCSCPSCQLGVSEISSKAGDVFQLGMEMRSALRLSRGRHASEGLNEIIQLFALSSHANAHKNQVKLCSGNISSWIRPIL